MSIINNNNNINNGFV